MKKILIVSPETYPLVKVGGLGKVTLSLFNGLKKYGTEVKMISAPENIYGPLNSQLIEEKNRNLGRQAVKMCDDLKWEPDWVWCHDWGGLWSIDELKKYNKKVKTVWTVHSPISLGGYGYAYDYGYYGYNGGEESIDWGDDFFSFSDFIKEGSRQVDICTTVSKNYASKLNESGLFGKEEVKGVNLGIDLDFWNPKTDRLVTEKLLGSDWQYFKNKNRSELQRIFGLPIRQVPVFVFMSRLVLQKGVELLIKTLPEFLAKNDVQFIIVGEGKQEYKDKLNCLKKRFGNKLGLKLEADFDLPHQIYAGADYLVLPSIEEPFGLVVAEAKRYGTVPVVFETGGLVDQVKDGVTGLSFKKYGLNGLVNKLNEAVLMWQGGFWWSKQDYLCENVKGEMEMTNDFLSVLYG